ncbi:unnamed protein product [Didymodactylos carnosus]|uniref:phosphatidylinositol 3-kinase n=1 Tax=Didymodactylos carnosus TaxID=1234261 RepID=A0A8S2D5F1_9BILA|nr:unnamed protein product [Didymodactylos carnosus]CAF3590833.1 unnamed protein product [Didymodactylos carnosus]
MMSSEKFHFIFSHELEDRIQIKIGSLEGERPQQNISDIFTRHSFVRNQNDSKRNEPYVLCQIFSDQQPLCLPVQTSYKAFTDKWSWNEWLILPLRYCDLPRHSVLTFTIHDILSPTQIAIIGSTTISLFAHDGTFRRGICDLKLWPNVVPDVNYESSTPGNIEHIHTDYNEQILSNNTNLNKNIKQQQKVKPPTITWNDESEYPMLDELSRIAKLIKTHGDGHTISQDWLDKLALTKAQHSIKEQLPKSKSMLLMIEFARTMIDENECTVLYFEPNCEEIINYPLGYTGLVVYDPELDMENIVESKHLKLARSGRKAMDKDLKPTREQRDRLMTILTYPPGQYLSIEEQDLVWKYRFFLSTHKKALAKFLQCVHWDKEEEVKQALDLLQQWVAMDTEDALELLGPLYHHPKVRIYAVSRLKLASDDDLLLYLLQLVQALRYERYDFMNAYVVDTSNDEQTSSNGSGTGENYANVVQSDSASQEIDLSTFLIQRACDKPIVANYLFWYAYVECENNSSQAKDKAISDMYQAFVHRLSMTLKTKNDLTRQVRSSIDAQKRFVDKLVELTNIVKRLQGSVKTKEEKLKTLLLAGDDSSVKFNFLQFDPIPLPLDPEVKIKRIIPDKIKIFKIAKLPFLFVCETVEGEEYSVIFKNGDDLRQDQLILQIITLMDRILRKENIDLRMTPYKVLSTSIKYGFVQFIESQSLHHVLEYNKSIKHYLQKTVGVLTTNETTGGNAGENDLTIPKEVMDSYVKSCAGYCVVTYLLGVGDRHLDNLLLRDTGQLFHIDFGFIMGRDPKPLPPAMRVSRDMIELLDQERVLDFRRHCFTAFIILRKHANVFANLFSLMLDSNIPDIALERDKTVKKLLDKFRLDLDDEKAVSYLKDLIDSIIERPALSDEMRDALRRHVIRERQRKKEEKQANEADKQRRREEKAKAELTSKAQLEKNAEFIQDLEAKLDDLQNQKNDFCNLLKKTLNEEDCKRKQSQQTVNKEPSWTSLYSPNLQPNQYLQQHFLTQPSSCRLLAYKPPQLLASLHQTHQQQSTAPPTLKRPRSPSLISTTNHQQQQVYSTPSTYSTNISKSPRPSIMGPSSIHTRSPSPAVTTYPSSSPSIPSNTHPSRLPSFPNPSAFSSYLYPISLSLQNQSQANKQQQQQQQQSPQSHSPTASPSSSLQTNQNNLYSAQQLHRLRQPSQQQQEQNNYLNSLSFLQPPLPNPQSSDSKQQHAAIYHPIHEPLAEQVNTMYVSQLIFNDQLKSLRECSLCFGLTCVMKLDLFKMKQCNIEKLTIQSIYLHDLLKLFYYIPKIKSLTVTVKDVRKDDINQQQLLTAFDNSILSSAVPYLTYLNLYTYQIGFSSIEVLLKQFFRLEYFILRSKNLELIDGRRWEMLLTTANLPVLKKFQFQIEQFHDTKWGQQNDVEKLVGKFQTQFWLEKQEYWGQVKCDYRPSDFLCVYLKR